MRSLSTPAGVLVCMVMVQQVHYCCAVQQNGCLPPSRESVQNPVFFHAGQPKVFGPKRVGTHVYFSPRGKKGTARKTNGFSSLARFVPPHLPRSLLHTPVPSYASPPKQSKSSGRVEEHPPGVRATYTDLHHLCYSSSASPLLSPSRGECIRAGQQKRRIVHQSSFDS